MASPALHLLRNPLSSHSPPPRLRLSQPLPLSLSLSLRQSHSQAHVLSLSHGHSHVHPHTQALRSGCWQALAPLQARRRGRSAHSPSPGDRPLVHASSPSGDLGSLPRTVTGGAAGAGAGVGAGVGAGPAAGAGTGAGAGGSQVVRVAVGVPTVAEEAAALGAPQEGGEEREFKRQWARTPKRICIFVEPSPFAYVCGYKNRFQNFIRNLQEGGDEVLVVTTHKGAPEEFHGAKVLPAWSFGFPLYESLPVSFGLSPRIVKRVADFKPDIIHASSPGIMCFGALVVAKILSSPLVFSYHTHVPKYIPKYTFAFLVHPMWAIIRFLHRAGDLTLTTSGQLGQELVQEGATAGDRACVWPKGIDCQIFHPRFRSHQVRTTLTGGEPEKPLLLHVGRLGAEKNLALLRPLLDKLPGVRLAFVGDGPYRQELERLFAGTPTVFTGMLAGEALSSAYASADVFLMPSETETLGFVVLESMASGVPVVAARAGGIPDIVSREGVNGFLFEPGNSEELLSKVETLLGSAELRERVGEAGRAEVERFEWRAATATVRREFYSAAVYLFRKKRLAGSWWRRLLPSSWFQGSQGKGLAL